MNRLLPGERLHYTKTNQKLLHGQVISCQAQMAFSSQQLCLKNHIFLAVKAASLHIHPADELHSQREVPQTEEKEMETGERSHSSLSAA